MVYKRSVWKSITAYEWKKQILSQKWRYLAVAAIALWTCRINWNLYGSLFTMKDYFQAFLQGMPPVVSDSREKFLIPGDWCAFFVILLYTNGKMAKDYTGGSGLQILIRTRRASQLWHAKWTAAVCSTAVYFGCAYVALTAGALIVSGREAVFLSNSREALIQFLLPFLAASVIVVWQLVFSMVFSQVAGVAGMVILLVLSAYFDRWYLPGNYLMKIRARLLLEQTEANFLCMYLLMLLAVAVLSGHFLIQKTDYIRDKGDY